MRQRHVSFLYILIFLAIAGLLAASAVFAAPAPAPGDRLSISGLVTDPMGKGLKEVEVEVLVNGQHVKPEGKAAEVSTGKPGGFVADFNLPAGTLPAAKVEVKAAKPSWKPIPATPVKVVEAGADAQGNKLFQAAQNLTLNRTITPGFWIASPRPAAGLCGHFAGVDAPHPGVLSGRGPHHLHHLYPGDLG